MKHKNVEIKAYCASLKKLRKTLRKRGARFAGEDRQVDTYFGTTTGRLKLREGEIENSLIHYERNDDAGPKVSHITRCDTSRSTTDLKQVLASALGVVTVVDKRREIYFDGNVKIHLDTVDGLGSFVEIEAIDVDGLRSVQDLERQCREFIEAFEIAPDDLIRESYSDMMRDPRERGVSASERAA